VALGSFYSLMVAPRVSAMSLAGRRLNTKARDRPASRVRHAFLLAVVVLTAPLWLVALFVIVLGRFVQVVALYALVWLWWIGRAQRRVLFVYSDSPNWKEYIEANIVPKLPANTVVLNWSNRARWPSVSLPAMLFRCFAGEREFNPIGLVFERFDVVGVYRFWQPFRDAKHGRLEALQLVETRFLEHAAG
jgi:hypothetical protein